MMRNSRVLSWGALIAAGLVTTCSTGGCGCVIPLQALVDGTVTAGGVGLDGVVVEIRNGVASRCGSATPVMGYTEFIPTDTTKFGGRFGFVIGVGFDSATYCFHVRALRPSVGDSAYADVTLLVSRQSPDSVNVHLAFP